MKKSDIRKRIFKIRKKKYLKNLSINFKNLVKVLKSKKLQKGIIGGYYPYNHEINIIHILEKLEKSHYKISLPKIEKKFKMNFFSWSYRDPLIINKYGIPEPISNKVLLPDILLVPLVAYDENKNRIGYGGGFYDRYIKRLRKTKKVLTIGLAFSFQKVKKIPINDNDIKLDFIINEKKELI